MGRTGHGRRFPRVFRRFSAAGREHYSETGMTIRPFLNAVFTIAYKEFIHVWRDRRVLLSIIILPPFFTLVFGHAFEDTGVKDVPAMYYDADRSAESQKFLELLKAKGTFQWRDWHGDPRGR